MIARRAANPRYLNDDGPLLHLQASRRTPAMLVDVREVTSCILRRQAGPVRSRAAGQLRHLGTSRLVVPRLVQRDHILAITQAICEYRRDQGTDGPLFLAKDTHALSEPAFETALEVLAANDVDVMVDQDLGYTPTPALSHAILTYNRGRTAGLADGIVITPSHNPPEDGGFKYNPPTGGPADTTATKWIEDRANALLAAGLSRGRVVTRRCDRRTPRTATITFRTTSTIWTRWWTWTRCAARAPHTLRRSPGRRRRGLLGPHRRTVRTKPHGGSTIRWTPRSASCASIGTARSAWIARRPTPWRG